MITLPQTIVVGTLTADPELRFTPGGAAVANFSIACNTRKKEGDQWVDGDATFIRCSIWKEYAENVTESLKKGLKVIAYGTLKQRDWEKDNVKRSVIELEVEEIGPTLRFATANVTRSSGGGARQPVAAAQGPGGDPWGGGAATDGPDW